MHLGQLAPFEIELLGGVEAVRPRWLLCRATTRSRLRRPPCADPLLPRMGLRFQKGEAAHGHHPLRLPLPWGLQTEGQPQPPPGHRLPQKRDEQQLPWRPPQCPKHEGFRAIPRSSSGTRTRYEILKNLREMFLLGTVWKAKGGTDHGQWLMLGRTFSQVALPMTLNRRYPVVKPHRLPTIEKAAPSRKETQVARIWQRIPGKESQGFRCQIHRAVLCDGNVLGWQPSWPEIKYCAVNGWPRRPFLYKIE